MKLYRAKIPEISSTVISRLTESGAIEVTAANRQEAEKDLTAIMETYLREDRKIREAVRENMAERRIAFHQFGRQLSREAKFRNHPLGEQVEIFLGNQFINVFLNSAFYDEVYVSDNDLRKILVDLLKEFHVDEEALREIVRQRLSNLDESTMEYEIRFGEELRKVRQSQGLIIERSKRNH